MENTALPKEELQEAFDRIVQQVTERVAGIRLARGEVAPGEELCSVHAAFERGQLSSLTLCAETALFGRLTRRMMRQENVTPEDVEDFSKEYFNILCGHIAAELFARTRVPVRFGIPDFYYGRYRPEELEVQFELDYASDENESVQLIHHAPTQEGQITT